MQRIAAALHRSLKRHILHLAIHLFVAFACVACAFPAIPTEDIHQSTPATPPITFSPAAPSSLPSRAALPATSTIPQQRFLPEQLQADLDHLFTTLEAVHPNLYATIPKAHIDRERARLAQELTTPLSLVEFYLQVAPLVAQLNDSHTRVFPPYDEFWNYGRSQRSLFPLNLAFIEERAIIVTKHVPGIDVPLGSELLSINNIPIATIRDTLSQLTSGERMEYRRVQVAEHFDKLLWMRYGFEAPFLVSFLAPGSTQVVSKTISGLVSRSSVVVADLYAPTTADYTYTTLPNLAIGLIDFRRFHDQAAFDRFLQRTFAQIQRDNIQQLIIDLRRNGGGNSALGDALLGYLTDQPFTQFAQVQLKISSQTRSRFGIAGDQPDGELVTNNIEPEAPSDNPLRFAGKVYVLIGPETFSSATALAATFKDYQVGVLIGEETGGLPTSYGDVYSFQLPESGLHVGVSFKHFTRPSGHDDRRGVLPDHEVRVTANDIATNHDPVLAFAKQLIAER
jgi:hypothetical protein